MPLGDSITFGYLSSDGNGYREHLFSQLVAENNDVDMVGSVQAGTMADNFNEGHPGWVITQIAGAAAASTGLEPNVVLLHAGTNDMNIPTDPTKAYERLGALIDQLNHGWPAAAILVAQIIPAANNSTMTNINAYNAQIPGLRVFATARKADSIADLAALGIETLSLEVDKPESIKVVVQDIQQRTGGGLDILVNNAGRNYTVPALDIDFDEVQQTFEVNVFAVMRMCQEFAPLLIEAKGTIVQIGSLAGIMPYVFGSVYNASKAALHAYSNTLRVELAPFGVKVVTIVTGGVKSRIARTERMLPEGSLYVPIEEEYQRRTKHSQEGAMPNEAYARSVVSQVLKPSPPKWVWEGNKAWLVWFIDAFLPKGFMDLVFTRMFNLWKLNDYTSMKKKN
ncbi:NADPH-dependent 1-acyl dihydroxyacetone phosphate reductase [Cryomyces antarcticus]|nr:NADPH-dependent 1-acyl dihydroxyacetone phosphate reductase [Cryomyces antarcticus]